MSEDYSDLIDKIEKKPNWLKKYTPNTNLGDEINFEKKIYKKNPKAKPSLSYVIRGIYKRKKIPAPVSLTGSFEITPQKIKESVFQLIENHCPDFSKMIFFDCFTGSSQMALEALSLEAKHAYLLDQSKIQIKQLKEFYYQNQIPNSTIICIDFIHAIQKYLKQAIPIEIIDEAIKNHLIENSSEKYFVFYLDPPYEILLNKTELIQNFLQKMTEEIFQKKSLGNFSFIGCLFLVQGPSIKSNFFRGKGQIKRKKDYDEFCNYFDKNYHYGKNQVLLKFLEIQSTQ